MSTHRSYLTFGPWWYFDATLSDGSIIVTTFILTVLEPFGLIGQVNINLTPPEGAVVSAAVPVLGLDVNAFSRERADVPLGTSHFSGNLDTYQIVVDPEQMGGLGANLVLERIAPPYRPGTGIVSAGDKYFAWFDPVPFGRVTGTVTYQEQTSDVEGVGYHDHNWGNIPMPLLIEDWWWGRMQMDEYTVVASEVRYAAEYGGTIVTQLAIFKGDTLVLDGARLSDHLTLIEEDIANHPDPNHIDPAGDALARTVTWLYEDGEDFARLTFYAGAMLESGDMRQTSLFRTIPPDSALAQDTTITPWYTRFASSGVLEFRLAGSADTVQGRGTLERMDFR